MKGQGNKVVMTRTFAAPLGKVWRAWTDPAIIAKWFSANPDLALKVLEFDARTGGGFRFAFVGSNGQTIPGEYRAKFIELKPRSKIVFAVADNTITGGDEDSTARFTAKFKEEDGQTKLIFTAELPSEKYVEITHSEWNKCFDHLSQVVTPDK